MLLQEYSKALNYVRTFLQIEPGNQQVQKLETLIKKKMEKGLYFCRNWYFYLFNPLSLRLLEVKEYIGAGSFMEKNNFFCHQEALCMQALIIHTLRHSRTQPKITHVICQEKQKLYSIWKQFFQKVLFLPRHCLELFLKPEASGLISFKIWTVALLVNVGLYWHIHACFYFRGSDWNGYGRWCCIGYWWIGWSRLGLNKKVVIWHWSEISYPSLWLVKQQ